MNKLLPLLCVSLLVSAYARAEDAGTMRSETQKTVEAQPMEPKTAPGQDKQVSKLAEKYGVPATEVQALRDQKLGWGEIKHALAISQKSGKPVSEVMELRKSGMGWGKIAKHYGFKLGDAEAKTPKGKGLGRGHNNPHKK